MPEEAYQMDEEFRGALADVVDGRAWAGYAGPGAAVRERGRRRRRRVAATSAAGVAVVTAAVAATSAGLAGGGSRSATSALSSGQSTAGGTGRYVKLTDALLHTGDLGTGFRSIPAFGVDPFFAVGLCSRTDSRTTTGTPVRQEFDGTGGDGVRISTDEYLYQFQDGATARAAFEAVRTFAHAGCTSGGGMSIQAQDVNGVGDGMFLMRQYVGGTDFRYSAYVLAGGVVIDYTVTPGSSHGLTGLPAAWLTDVGRKAVARVHDAPRTDTALNVPKPPSIAPQGGGSTTARPFPVSQPVDGFLFAPSDLGPSFTADHDDEWHGKQIASAASATGMTFRGTMTGGDGEFLVNEGVYRFTDATAAQSGLAAYRQNTTSTHNPAVSLTGLGDEAWIKHWDTKGGVTVAIRSGANVITFDVLAGGASADQPIPDGDAWVQQIAHIAVQRLAAAK